MFRVSSAVLPLASCRKCTGLVAVLVATALALLCPRPAAAQSYYGSGSWSFSSTVDSSSDAPGTGSSTLGAYKSIEIGPDGTASVNIAPQGQARITAFWSPPSGASGMLPPKTVTVRFT